jgi:hypothetical protein
MSTAGSCGLKQWGVAKEFAKEGTTHYFITDGDLM